MFDELEAFRRERSAPIAAGDIHPLAEQDGFDGKADHHHGPARLQANQVSLAKSRYCFSHENIFGRAIQSRGLSSLACTRFSLRKVECCRLDASSPQVQ
jgi:hypothetical protein